MEFAEWVVAGLDQLRLGQLPAGNSFYQAASTGLGGDPKLDAFMTSGDPAARAELVQAIADAVAANPEFEQQLRTAAAAATAAQPQQQGVAGGTPPFLKTTNGMLVLVAAAVVVVGGGIGLAVGLGGSGGGTLASIAKGTWTCQTPGGTHTLTIGDGTWSASGDSGTWKQDGSTATLHDNNDPDNDALVTGLPSGAGSFDVALGEPGRSQEASVHVKGTLSAHKITIAVPGDRGDVQFTCTK